jgi:exosortase/archaeosortase
MINVSNVTLVTGKRKSIEIDRFIFIIKYIEQILTISFYVTSVLSVSYIIKNSCISSNLSVFDVTSATSVLNKRSLRWEKN